MTRMGKLVNQDCLRDYQACRQKILELKNSNCKKSSGTVKTLYNEYKQPQSFCLLNQKFLVKNLTNEK